MRDHAQALTEATIRQHCKRLRTPTIGAQCTKMAEQAIQRRLREAHLPRMKTLEEFDFSQAPQIPAGKIREIAEEVCHRLARLRGGSFDMPKRIAAGVALLALLVPISCAQSPTKRSSGEEFQKFWSDFRAAALAKDTEKIVSMTNFPFKTKGILDSDPVAAHDASSFGKLLPKLLQQDVGKSREPEPMLRFMERKANVTAKDLGQPGANNVRVGQFVFQKVQGRWLFAQAYVEE